MKELSRASGFSVATIKYYLRERLLPPGERTSPNQAIYSPDHVQRLHLIRALTELGGLSIAEVRAALHAIDQRSKTSCGVVNQLDFLAAASARIQPDAAAHGYVLGFLRHEGDPVQPQDPPVRALANAIALAEKFGLTTSVDLLRHHLRACQVIAQVEPSQDSRNAANPVEHAVMHNLVSDVALLALKRIVVNGSLGRPTKP